MQAEIRRLSALFVLCVLVPLAVFSLPAALFGQEGESMEERRARLEQELAVIEEDIAQKRGVLEEKQQERTTLERDIAILDNQIAIAQQQIRHRDLTISQIRDDIGDKQVAISELDKKFARSTASLAQLLRRTREIDDTSLVEIVLAGSLSDFFQDIDDFEAIGRALDDSFDEIAALRSELSARRSALQTQQSNEEELRRLQVLEREAIQTKEREKQDILEVTKGEEEAYQDLIAERERQAAQIRSALFNLRDSAAIPFGTAYEYAKAASAQTGVRPALILAILRQESNLGENVGQCLLTNQPEKGDGKGRNTGRHFDKVMHPTRDVDPFMEIAAELGFDPFAQVVSCPQSIGYGGAMGPSQFIPSTWMLYKDRLARITGESPPNPWNARTAIFATALLMADNGADKGTREAERLAALRYFAGWVNATRPAFAVYGDGVMGYADQYQRDIDILEG